MTNTDDTDTNCVTKPDLTHDSLQALLSLLLVYDILNKISSLVMIDIEAGRRLYIRTCLLTLEIISVSMYSKRQAD